MLPPQTQTAMLAPGDRVPDVGLMNTSGKLISLMHQDLAGEPIAILVYPANDKSAYLREVEKFAELLPRFQAAGARVLIVNRQSAEANAELTIKKALKFPVLADVSGAVTAALGLGTAGRNPKIPGCFVAIIDSNQRLVKRLESLGEARLAVPALKAIEALGKTRVSSGGDGLVIHSQAPVLLIPNVFDAGFCATLIKAWESGDRFDGGVSRSSSAAANNLQYGYKRREDLVIQDDALLQPLLARVRQHVWEEMYKAFLYRPTHCEAFRIGCYQAQDQGFFAPHRDNKTPLTKHRRFAMTLCLNEDYEGGYLRFSEYGPQLYKPGTGSAVIFSCELLHEVMPVTQGRRFALINFYYGEAEAAEVASRMRQAPP